MVIKRIGLLLILLSFAFLTHAQEEAPPNDCPFPAMAGITCGLVDVPLDHADPDGQQIQLAYAILHSTNPEKVADPLIFVNGGPGGAMVAYAPIYQTQFLPFLAERDVILVDQRGVGLSRPALYCPVIPDNIDYINFAFDQTEYQAGLDACRASLQAQGIDPELFNADQMGADFASLRVALGYEQVNLYGISHGTRLALITLRDNPEGIRSVILDSVLPPEVDQWLYNGQSFYAALQALNDDCQANLLCRFGYGDLVANYQQAFDQLSANPPTLTSGEREVLFTAQLFRGTVQMELMNPSQIPAIINDVLNQDYRRMEERLAMIVQAPPRDMSGFFTVICADASNQDAQQIAEADAGLPQAFQQPQAFYGYDGYRLCEAWGLPEQAINTARAESDVPVLLLSGEYDPLTPPQWAQTTAEGLSNSWHFTVPYASHVLQNNKCAQTIMRGFINNPTSEPDSTCLQDAELKIALNYGATRPPIQMLTVVLGVISVFFVGQMGLAFGRNPRWIAWTHTMRIIGWIPFALSLLLISFLVLNRQQEFIPQLTKATEIIISLMPLFMALQVAMIFAMDEEPSLEMLLALPRSLKWLILERFFVVLFGQLLVGLVGAIWVISVEPETSIIGLFASWIPAALFMSGLSLMITIRTRTIIFGVFSSGLLWALAGLFSGIFTPGMALPFPLDVIQSFMWAINIHPTQLLDADFWLNRAFLAVAGISLVAMALKEVSDPEKVLLNAGKRQKSKTGDKRSLDYVPLVMGLHLDPVSVQPQAIWQMLGIVWYEFVMQWRRRHFIVVTLSLIATCGFALWISRDVGSLPLPTVTNENLLSIQESALVKGVFLVGLAVAPVFLIVYAMMVPVMVSDVTLMDAQMGTDELLNTMPIGINRVLLAKVGAIWLTIMMSLVIALGVICIEWWFVSGPFNPDFLIDLIVWGLVPAIVINSGIAVLIGATQRSRRMALLLAVAWVGIPNGAIGISFLTWILPQRTPFLIHYVTEGMSHVAMIPVTAPEPAWQTTLLTQINTAGFIQLVCIAIAVLAWKHYRRAS